MGEEFTRPIAVAKTWAQSRRNSWDGGTRAEVFLLGSITDSQDSVSMSEITLDQISSESGVPVLSGASVWAAAGACSGVALWPSLYLSDNSSSSLLISAGGGCLGGTLGTPLRLAMSRSCRRAFASHLWLPRSLEQKRVRQVPHFQRPMRYAQPKPMSTVGWSVRMCAASWLFLAKGGRAAQQVRRHG